MQAGSDSSTQQRLFVAIHCPLSAPVQAVLDELRAAQLIDGSGLRVVAADTLHITLKFLGSVADERIPALRGLLTSLGPLHETFSVALGSVGSFHSALWLGVAPHPQLLGLAQSLSGALEPFGFAADARTFRPHVTLARLNRNPRFDRNAWLQLHRDTPWATIEVRDLRLYRSETRAEGARYSIVHTVALRHSA
ncbi:MAG: ligase [Pseudomonadota bacterium]|jgi:2'-5' RNA ligase